MEKFLVIQTAFIGDVVLATGLLEKLHAAYPDAQIDVLVRKGNEGLLTGHPFLHEVLIWDKKENKLANLWKMSRRIRRSHYDKVINVQRFAATGLLTVLSGAKETIGFDKNPMSRFFTKRVPHVVSYSGKLHPAGSRSPEPDGPVRHEIERNDNLIKDLSQGPAARPALYPSAGDLEKVLIYKDSAYITVSPASVWFTKQYPADKWTDFIKKVPEGYRVYLLGAPSDKDLCESIRRDAERGEKVTDRGDHAGGGRVINLAGQLSFLQSAALMKDAVMNYVNDSAPMHFASAVNAPVTAVYCSTIPAFGFGPLSDKKYIVEITEPLECRPCGLHGYKACPLGHFNCARKIGDHQLLQTLISSP